uniref:C-type lectin domain-containing protein n=1 Tax=Caenorhabditis tropicalis TaxID=1561998 RepID=A0A1I7UXR0_9PELO
MKLRFLVTFRSIKSRKYDNELIEMVSRVFILLLGLITVSAIDFGSDSSSCEDDDHHGGGGHNHGGGNGGNNNGCPRGWRRFTRSSGGWCIRVYSQTNIEFSSAASACSNRNAVLSGIQDSSEMDYISQSASRNLASSTGSLWIGAKRTAACARSKLTATCSKTTSFYWTDSVTTGTAGFSWLDGSQPDNALGGNQDCIAFFFAPSTTRIANVNWFPGAMDDVNCVSSQFNSIPQRRIQGYVCGKAASS